MDRRNARRTPTPSPRARVRRDERDGLRPQGLRSILRVLVLCSPLLVGGIGGLSGQALEEDVRYPRGDLTLAALLLTPDVP